MICHVGDAFKHSREPSDPTWQPRPGSNLAFDDALPVQPCSLQRRLTAEQRQAIIEAFEQGTLQRVVAARYGISVRGVKRLVRAARNAGVIDSQPQAT